MTDTCAAFKPGGRQTAISAPTAAPPAGVQLDGSNSGDISVLIYNPGPNPAWIGYGATAAEATANAVIPIVGTATLTVASGPGSYQPFTFNAKTFFSAIASTGTQLVYLTSGQGI